MGWTILQPAFQVLLYAPSQSNCISTGTEILHTMNFNFSIWYLEPYVRRNWLMSVVVIMYKVIVYCIVYDDNQILFISYFEILHFNSTSTPNRHALATSITLFGSFSIRWNRIFISVNAYRLQWSWTLYHKHGQEVRSVSRKQRTFYRMLF